MGELVERLNGVATAIDNRILMTHRYPLRNDDIAAIKDAGRRLREAATALASAEGRAAELQRHVDLLSEKITGNSCGCAYDTPDDVCMHHSPMLVRAEARAAELEVRIENAKIAASETQLSWKHTCHTILSAIGLDFGDPDWMRPEDVKKLEEAEARADRLEKERDDLLTSHTDKARAWDMIAEKNARIIKHAVLVERAFRDGLSYASNCIVTDPDEAWRTSNVRKEIMGGGNG